MENFEARVKGYLKKLGQSWSGLEKILDEAIQEDMDLDQLRKSEQVLCIRFGEHRMLGKEYEVFLSDTRTKHSLELMEGLKENERRTERIVNSVLGQIELKRKLLLSLSDSEKMSTRSSRTKSSHSSNARSKAEAAKACIRLTEKETELKKRQARIQEERAVQAATAQREADEIEADLGLLRDKKLYAEAAAEAEAYITLDEFKEHEENSVTNQSVENPMERTRRYVENHASSDALAKENLCSTVLKPDADSFVPRLPAHSHSPPPAIAERKIDIDMGTEFGRFLVKKDLLMTRFTRFQDDPVTYTVWKATFRNITEELGVNPSEEIDLLVKWLGPESSKQALSLRSANAYNPVCGLHRIWERLDARYGTPELVESALRKKITSFPKLTNKDNKRLYDLLDLLLEVASLKETPEYMPLLATYDTSLGVNQIVSKIPYYLQNRWMSKAAKYKLEHGATFPPFIFFVQFIREQTAMLNDPCFSFHSDPIESRKAKEDTVVKHIRTRKTDVDQPSSDQPSDKRCPLHPHSNTHCLDTCKEFAKRSIDEKRQILKDNRICFRCCASDKHLIKDCKAEVKCAECKSPKHVTALHIHKSEKSANRTTPKLEVVKQPDAVSVAKSDCSPTVPDGGEDTDVTCNCAQLCGAHGASKSCAKIVKVNVHLKDNSNSTMQLYALIDDQSNRSLASPELLDNFKDFTESERVQYTLSSCAGTVKTTGRRVKGLAATSMDGETTYELPTLIECSEIPANPSEIPTPEAAAMHPHLKDISDQIPPLDTTSGIHLLLGRDAVDIHHVLDQRIGPKGSPFAQKIGLGWVIIGEVCLNKVHTPNLTLNVNKTYTVKGHDSIFEPCQYNLSLREDDVKDKLFERTKEDDKPGWSVEDRLFIEVMNREFFKDKQGFWSAPLPFRLPRKIMPNNRSMALQRAKALQKSLNDNPVKKQHFVTFMDKVISSRAAEVAPTSEGEVWYLPIFGVYNVQKPNQIRGVFDSSATFQGTSLNDQLLPGPNLTNNLIGLLLRFRENEFAAAADIEQMFYSFHVNEGHRNLLRFFWYRNNDPTQDLIEFRMKAHVFGNSPSPAVAAYGLRKSVEGDGIDQDVKAFVNQNFYVDDGLVSSDSEESVVSLLKRTQITLKEKGNLRLHKFISNSPKIMSSFPAQDLGKEMKNLQLDKDNLPTHKSLGLLWDLNTDNFTFDTSTKTTACTRRGILSMLNSIYDPLGFAAPITIRGKVLMRDLTKGYGWDDSLPEDAFVKWNAFEMSIAMLRELLIPRMIVPVSLSRGHGSELHVFCDASEQAVCAVAYLRTLDQQANQHMGFVLGKAKVAPTHGHTIPRLELCAALLGTEIAKMVEKELSVDLKSTKFYTDSKVVLGYLNNKRKRFYQYVSNRVQRILDASISEQWFYIASQNNPADCGTRGLMTAEEVKEKWLTGPRKIDVEKSLEGDRDFPLLNEKEDKEIRVEARKTEVYGTLESTFRKFSVWSRLVSALTVLKRAMRGFGKRKSKTDIPEDKDLRTETEAVIIRHSQQEHYNEELRSLGMDQPISKSSPLIGLNPILDPTEILRVGGRLDRGCLPFKEAHPIIIPRRAHIADLLVRHFHESIHHQGRVFTEGALRKGGYWVIGAKKLVSSVIHKCVTCRKLRGTRQQQIMADLPPDRLTPGPPFTSVGIDTFGPWQVISRRTRGGSAQSKRWAIMFTCLTTRAVHIEIVEEMSSSSFINALRRLIALRGNVKEIRSDRGTNFVGAAEELKLDIINVEDGPVRTCLRDSGITWRFNAPHASHMGGVWERMIRIARNIFDAMLLNLKSKDLTHEVLVTLMAEVTAIMNSRPLSLISNDPEDPVILTPAMLLNVQCSPPVGVNLCEKDMFKKQWKMVQVLADMFWKRWQLGYMQSLQARRKWQTKLPCIKNGDVVLLRDKCLARSEWPMGVVINTLPSESDNKVRKAEVRVYKNGKSSTYTRPITEMVLLVE